MSSAQRTLFIADLHLDSSRPETIALAERYLAAALGADSLYILGDLFEYWLGDDAISTLLLPVVDALKNVSASGTQVHLMHGNRDFLLGDVFAERIGATLHRADQICLQLNEHCTLLMHGDTLCTDDHSYQQLRTLVRDPAWQHDFLSKKLDDRIAEAQELRNKSRTAVAGKTNRIMDVNPTAVESALLASNCDLLIHGHTHRPAEHQLSIRGKVCRRIVLGDWHADHAQVVCRSGSTLELQTFTG